ncbi:MAG TPA: hypothetical protein DDW30_07065 [Clostridiales bacterium]|nr:hypothetical protein [Clostridiales bacterium]
MKKIRLLSVLLTLCLLISMIPVYAIAEEGDVAKVGETGYATLKEAIDAAPDGGTVEVLRDFDSSESIKISGKTITLKGNGKNETFTGTANPFVVHDAHVTIKDLTLTYTGGTDAAFVIRVETENNVRDGAALSLVLDNCTVTSESLAFKSQAYNKTGKQVLKLQNGTSVNTIGTNDTILVNDSNGGGVNLEVTVDNSTVKKSNGATNNPALFMINGNKAEAPEKNVTVNVINGGHLVCANGTDTSASCGSGNYMFYGRGTANTVLKVNLDATAVLELAQGANTAVKYNSFMGFSDANGKPTQGVKTATLNDMGATWKISKESYAKTPYYPAFNPTKDQIGWMINDVFYAMPANLSCDSWPKLPTNLDATNGITMKLQVQAEMTDAEAITKGYVCRIGNEGDTYYTTLAEAIGKADGGATITLIQDVSQGATALSANGKTFVLNGNGKKLTGGVDGLLTFIDSTVTVRNLTLNNTTGAAIVIRTSGTATPSLTLEGCTITSAKLVFKRQVSTAEGATGGDGLLTVTVKDSTVTKTGADDLMLINDTNNKNSAVSNTKLVIDNSTFTTEGGGSSNGAMFKIAGDLEKALTVELKNGAKLVAANNGGANVPNTLFESALTTENSQVSLTVNAEEGTTLELAPSGTVKENRFVNGGFAELAINDNHATWKVSKTAVDQGAYYPTGFTSTVVGMIIENKLYKPNPDVKLDTVTADAKLNIIYLEDLAFEVLAGASVRTADPAGIRFRTAISHEVYELLKSCGVNIEFGSYIAPTAIVNKHQQGAFDPTKLERLVEGSTVKIVCGDFAVTNDEDGANLFYACLYGMTTKEQYEMKLSIVSYITLTYENSASGETFLTSYNEEDHSRSMLEVARDAIAAGNDSPYLQSIVDACAT